MLVYVTSSRTGRTDRVAHVYARTQDGIAVTQCDIWARGGIKEAARSDDGFRECRWCFPKATAKTVWDCHIPTCGKSEAFTFWHCLICGAHNGLDSATCQNGCTA
jgi:hypothetical protein